MRVLVVSPHFPPTNAADMQRVRMVLPYFSEVDIHSEVLAVEPDQVASPRDTWLEASIPKEIRIHRVKALGLDWAHIPGFGTLSLRALSVLKRKGNELLGRQGTGINAEANCFDLVYFSTTQFGVHTLGPYWRRKFGVPFVMDYQDPWVNDFYREHPEVRPPGGRLKYRFSSQLSRMQEPRVLRECSGITSVSSAYPTQLERRYPWLKLQNVKSEEQMSRSEENFAKREDSGSSRTAPIPYMILPFPGDPRDLERVKEEKKESSYFDRAESQCHWVYVGRGGRDMVKSFRALFRALASMPKQKLDSVRLHFVGTSYASAGRGEKTVEPLALEFGLDEIVTESPDRIPYRETLRLLLEADALIVPGSEDAGYTASKIYPYLLAEKPLLAVFHENSSVVGLLESVGGGTCVTFSDETSEEVLAEKIAREVEPCFPGVPEVSLCRENLEPFLARAQSERLAKFFNHCLAERNCGEPDLE